MMKAKPKWLTRDDRELMRLLRDEAKSIGMIVDHIVPIDAENVCGLDVYWNTQFLSQSDNVKKASKWPYPTLVPL
jgi:5-methylcytosine-specific restriction endonuclease McrA